MMTPASFSEIWKSSAIVLSNPMDTNSVVPIAKEPNDIASITARRRRSPISVCRGRGRRCGIRIGGTRFLTPRILPPHCTHGIATSSLDALHLVLGRGHITLTGTQIFFFQPPIDPCFACKPSHGLQKWIEYPRGTRQEGVSSHGHQCHMD